MLYFGALVKSVWKERLNKKLKRSLGDCAYSVGHPGYQVQLEGMSGTLWVPEETYETLSIELEDHKGATEELMVSSMIHQMMSMEAQGIPKDVVSAATARLSRFITAPEAGDIGKKDVMLNVSVQSVVDYAKKHGKVMTFSGGENTYLTNGDLVLRVDRSDDLFFKAELTLPLRSTIIPKAFSYVFSKGVFEMIHANAKDAI